MGKRSTLLVACGSLTAIAALLTVINLLANRSRVEEHSPNFLRRAAEKILIKDVEVVVAHYDEDLSWLEKAHKNDPHIKYTVYSKAAEPPKDTFSLPNVGREGQTFLHHIVYAYDNLAEWTVFTQGAAPGFGFFANNKESGHMCSGVTWDNYIHPEVGDDWYMVQTVATKFPEVMHTDRTEMMFRMPESKGTICPTDGRLGWSSWWKEEDHPLIKFQDMPQSNDSLNAMDFYNKYIVADSTDKIFKSVTLNFANGGRFAVSRDRILRRSRAYYKNLLDQLSKQVNPIEGYYMEAMWYDVFHPDRLQAQYGPECLIPPIPEGGPVKHQEMYKTTVRRVFGQDEVPRHLAASDPYIDLPTPAPVPAPTEAPTTGVTIRQLWYIGGSYFDRTANVGDTVMFDFFGTHTVYRHPSGTCDRTDSTLIGSTDPTFYTFTSSDVGKVTFACQLGTHCDRGMIVTFNVSGPPMSPAPVTPAPVTPAPSSAPVISPGGDGGRGDGRFPPELYFPHN